MTTPRTSDFSIPRATLPAELRFADGTTRRGVVFLLPHAATHSGPETPVDMLNRPDPVFPFRADDPAEVLLAPKARVVCLAVAHADDPVDPEGLTASKAVRVDIALADGTALSGSVAVDLPPSRSRLLDYLNEVPAPFFPVYADGVTHYVNRDQILYVQPHD